MGSMGSGSRPEPMGGEDPMEALIIFGGVYAAYLLGRLLQYLADAKRVLGKGNDRDGKR